MESVISFIFGLVVGSFINAQVYRIAIRYKILDLRFKIKNGNRSYCDFCGKQLKWWENVPVISYLIQGGKSRCCGKNLPLLYPVTEIVMGILLILNFQFTISNLQTINNYSIYNFKNVFLLLLGMAIIGFLVFSAVFDFKYMILPDFSTNSLIFLALVYKLVMGINANLILADALWGVCLYGFFYFLHVLTRARGMGFGDVKLAFAMGFFLGWPRAIVGLYTAFIVGAIAGIVVMIFFKKKRKNRLIPFGPFMILGILVAWWWGEMIWNFFIKALY